MQFYTEDDFTSTPLTATIPANTTTTTVRVPVMSDNIVEGDEMFSISLTVPSSLGPGIVAGSVTSATGIIVDSTSKRCLTMLVCAITLFTDISVQFTQSLYTGSEDTGFVLVTLELVGGTSSRPFNVTVTPLEQSSVSAEGNSVYDNVLMEGFFLLRATNDNFADFYAIKIFITAQCPPKKIQLDHISILFV